MPVVTECLNIGQSKPSETLLIKVIYCLQMVALIDYCTYLIDLSNKNRTDRSVWSISQRSRADRLRAQDRRTGDLQRQNAFQGNPILHMLSMQQCAKTVLSRNGVSCYAFLTHY